jgi:hypothetical protein
MKTYNLIKVISLIAYFGIMLKGSIISIPFIFYLICNLLLAGDIYQITTSVVAVLGLILLIRQVSREITLKRFLLEFLVLIMLIVPLIERLTSVSIMLFDYPSFHIPCLIFVSLYLVSLVLMIKTKNAQKTAANSRLAQWLVLFFLAGNY